MQQLSTIGITPQRKSQPNRKFHNTREKEHRMRLSPPRTWKGVLAVGFVLFGGILIARVVIDSRSAHANGASSALAVVPDAGQRYTNGPFQSQGRGQVDAFTTQLDPSPDPCAGPYPGPSCSRLIATATMTATATIAGYPEPAKSATPTFIPDEDIDTPLEVAAPTATATSLPDACREADVTPVSPDVDTATGHRVFSCDDELDSTPTATPATRETPTVASDDQSAPESPPEAELDEVPDNTLQLVSNTATKNNLVITDQYLFWFDVRGEVGAIYGYDLATAEEFLIRDTRDISLFELTSDGQTVAWIDYDSSVKHIQGYDLETRQEFTIHSIDRPKSSGEIALADGVLYSYCITLTQRPVTTGSTPLIWRAGKNDS